LHGQRLGYILRLRLAFLVPGLEVGWPVPGLDIHNLYEDLRMSDLLLFWFGDG
jgi:hypothetical protein